MIAVVRQKFGLSDNDKVTLLRGGDTTTLEDGKRIRSALLSEIHLRQKIILRRLRFTLGRVKRTMLSLMSKYRSQARSIDSI